MGHNALQANAPGDNALVWIWSGRAAGQVIGGTARLRFMTSRSLIVKVTAGKDDQERCSQAFTVAATGVASGLQVSLWLTGEAAWFALPERAGDVTLAHATPLAQLLEKVLAEGTVTVCSQCASRRNITPDDTIKGIRIAGSSTFLAEVMADGAQALVY
jgi:predicted peroxiredoxin